MFNSLFRNTNNASHISIMVRCQDSVSSHLLVIYHVKRLLGFIGFIHLTHTRSYHVVQNEQGNITEIFCEPHYGGVLFAGGGKMLCLVQPALHPVHL